MASNVVPFMSREDPGFGKMIDEDLLERAVDEVRSFCESRYARLLRGGRVLADLVSPISGRVQRSSPSLARSLQISPALAESLMTVAAARDLLDVERRSIDDCSMLYAAPHIERLNIGGLSLAEQQDLLDAFHRAKKRACR